MRSFRWALASMGWAVLFACASATDRAAISNDVPLVEVRVAYYEAAPDLERVEHDEQVLWLAPEPLISDSDLVDVLASFHQDPVGQDRLMLTLRCTGEASRRMELATGQHLDKPMVVLFDGEVRLASIVRGSAGCVDLAMHWPASEDEAERMAEKVRARWPEDDTPN